MGKEIKLTPQGQAVKGALAAYLAPRMAADGALKPGELGALLRTITPTGGYDKQIQPIASAVKAKFADRLAKDQDIEDLEEILESLKDEEDFDDDDMGDGVDNSPGVKLMEILSKCNIPEEELIKVNELITELGKSPNTVADMTMDGDAMVACIKICNQCIDACKAAMEENPACKPACEACIKACEACIKACQMPTNDTHGAASDVKKAMDAALPGLRQAAVADISARYRAGEKVLPLIGKIDVLAADSAPAIYKLALDAAHVETKGVPPEAFEAMVGILLDNAAPKAPIAVDKKSVDSFAEQYPNIPAQV